MMSEVCLDVDGLGVGRGGDSGLMSRLGVLVLCVVCFRVRWRKVGLLCFVFLFWYCFRDVRIGGGWCLC